ncbi:MAG: glycosyltransferase, partial [Cyanobacteria bacterium P01_F01_bin.4]
MVGVSVVIPAYNAMAYLPQTVENVLQQTYDDFEVILVNDGSSDNI